MTQERKMPAGVSQGSDLHVHTINPKLMLAVLIVASFIASYNENNVNVALPQIMSEFSIDSVAAQWLVSGYMVATACVATASAFLFDRLGVRKLFFCAAAFLIVGLAINLVAPFFPLLFVSRLIQACGTGICIPMMMSATLILAPEERRGFYMALGAGVVTLGPALAPVLGGFLVNGFGWRATIVVPLVVMVITALAGLVCVKDITQIKDAKIDAFSIALAAVALFSFTYGLSILTTQIVLSIVCIVVFAVLVVVFVRRQVKLQNPLLNVSLIANIRVWPFLLLVMVDMLSTFSLSVLLPLYYQQGCLMSADIAGLMLLVPLLINAVGCLVSGAILDRFGTWPAIPIGFLLIVIGQGIIAVTAASCNVPLVLFASCLTYAGVGISIPATNTTGCSAVPPSEYPAASALNQLFVMIAAAAGPPLFTGIMEANSSDLIAQGMSAALANAAGFSVAMVVATIIAIAGFGLSIFYARLMRKR